MIWNRLFVNKCQSWIICIVKKKNNILCWQMHQKWGDNVSKICPSIKWYLTTSFTTTAPHLLKTFASQWLEKCFTQTRRRLQRGLPALRDDRLPQVQHLAIGAARNPAEHGAGKSYIFNIEIVVGILIEKATKRYPDKLNSLGWY